MLMNMPHQYVYPVMHAINEENHVRGTDEIVAIYIGSNNSFPVKANLIITDLPTTGKECTLGHYPSSQWPRYDTEYS